MVRIIGARYGIAPEEGDELMQGLRTRLWRALGSSDRIAAVPAAYLYRAATSAALDIVRQRRAAEAMVTEEGTRAPLSLVDPAPRPDELLDRTELVALIDQAISTIAESRRPVVRMYLAGYGREEIAELLGWTEAKTRNLLYRGLADLRERLAEAGVRPALH